MLVSIRTDCDTLRNTVKRMEHVRQKAVQDAETELLETSSALNVDQLVGPNSGDWIQVETQTSSESTGAESGHPGDGTVVVTAKPVVELELRHRIEKLNATVTEVRFCLTSMTMYSLITDSMLNVEASNGKHPTNLHKSSPGRSLHPGWK